MDMSTGPLPPLQASSSWRWPQDGSESPSTMHLDTSPFITWPSALSTPPLPNFLLGNWTPLHSLVPEYRFSWHCSRIQGRLFNTSRENNHLGFWMPELDFKLLLISPFTLKGNSWDQPHTRSRVLQPHSGFKSDVVTDPFRDLTYPKLSDSLPTNHNLISNGQRPLENLVGNAI